MRNILAWVFSLILILLGFVSRAKKGALRGEYILSIYFHNPSKKEFEKCIKWLVKNKFHFINAADLNKIANKQVPFPKGAVFLSVDDGWQSNETNIVEVAKQYGIPVTIFVSTEPVETGVYWWSYIHKAESLKMDIHNKPDLKKMSNNKRLYVVNNIKNDLTLDREAMSIEQIKRISGDKNITIGGHTHTHPILPNCKEETVVEEIQKSKSKLESWTGKEVNLFAYPNGDFGRREKEILKNLNFRFGFSNQPKYLTRDNLRDPFNIPRFGFLEGATHAENICRITGIWQPLVRKNISMLKRKDKTVKGMILDDSDQNVKINEVFNK